MATINNQNRNLLKFCTTRALSMAKAAEATCGGMKKVAKLTKSACDALKQIHETYKLVPCKAILSTNNVASKFTDALGFFEPIVLVKECTLGDKNGIRPWEHFQGRGSYSKGFSWALKKAKVSTKFAKRLHSLQVVNLTCALTPFVVIGVACDLGTSTIKLVNKGFEFKNSCDVSTKLQGKFAKWNGRIKDITYDKEFCRFKLDKINDKISAQEKIKRKCVLKIAWAVALWVLTIFCIIALIVQIPYLNMALLTIGFACNLSSAIKLAAEVLIKNKKAHSQLALTASTS